jgi:tripartite-type tricarboxylate transporter receptor subunit TctC
MFRLRNGLVAAMTASTLCLASGMAVGQNYPTRPVRIIAAEPGGGADFVARLTSTSISPSLGQPVIVENRPAALNGELVSRAIPDGYTLLLASSTFIYAPLFEKTNYDTLKDFAPISMLAKAPNVVVVHPSVPVNSVKELVALAKAKPGVLNYSSGGTGSSLHLAAELFKQLAHVDIVRVAYKGAGPAMTALLGGEVQVMFATAATVAPNLKSGKLKALAVTGSQPSPLAPGLPTVSASGVPGYQMEALYALVAPLKTQPAVIQRLNSTMLRVLSEPDVKQKFLSSGVEASPSTPKELGNILKNEIAKVGKLIRDTGMKVN